MNKKEIRKNILNIRDNQNISDKNKNDLEILKNVLSLEEVKNATTIMIFVSYKSEVDTHELIKEFIKRGKRVLVPIVDMSTKTLLLSEIKNLNDLEVGSYGILEPKEDSLRIKSPDCVDLCIMPGAVFDKKGNRIGYGGGFYDKLIPLFRKDTNLVAICYEFQIIDDVPCEEHDKKVNKIVTESEVYEIL